jgi:hypothetical protein
VPHQLQHLKNKPQDGFEPPKVTLLKREFGTWHLTGFSGVGAPFLLDFNGTFELHSSFTPNKGLL